MLQSKYFTEREVTYSSTAAAKGISNTPTETEWENINRHALLMDEVRTVLGKPVAVSSWFRNRRLNTLVGGASTSAHVDGLATDFTCMGFGSPYEIVAKLKSTGIVFDQLIHEKKGGRNWVHIGSAKDGKTPRMQVLTITDAGTRVGLFKS